MIRSAEITQDQELQCVEFMFQLYRVQSIFNRINLKIFTVFRFILWRKKKKSIYYYMLQNKFIREPMKVCGHAKVTMQL